MPGLRAETGLEQVSNVQARPMPVDDGIGNAARR